MMVSEAGPSDIWMGGGGGQRGAGVIVYVIHVVATDQLLSHVMLQINIIIGMAK